MRGKHILTCAVLALIAILFIAAGSAKGVTIYYQSANTDIYLGEPYNNLEFENPLSGSETIKGYAILEWRDADYSAGPPPWYDDWTTANTGVEGDANEIWLRQNGHSITTTTTIPSKVVSIHMVGDVNDGLAKVYVDGVEVASMDMYTQGGSQTVLIIVKDLSKTVHTIDVNDLGLGGGQHGDEDDVATLGAAALEKRVKWSQPPEPTQPDDWFYGWNEPSDWWNGPVVADDWVCTTADPVTDVHWWGSFLNWTGAEPPRLPSHFHITIWTDAPIGQEPWSRPGVVLHSILAYNYTCQRAGMDYDPRTGRWETCFRFDYVIPQGEWFYQEPGGTAPNIYWVSIAACDEGTMTEFPWGWKTRPRDPASPAPDAAVVILDPIQPVVGNVFNAGYPIWWPHTGNAWDMAFELTSEHVAPPKWEQLPNPAWSGLHDHDYAGGWRRMADDWQCEGGPVTDLHWWGNYELDDFGNEKRGSGISQFHLSIHTPQLQNPCLPAEPAVWARNVPFASVNETDTGMINSEGGKIYKYEYILPEPYDQVMGSMYFFDVNSISVNSANPAIWRWQESNRYIYRLCPSVERTNSTPWQVNPFYSDMAFAITSGTGGTYVKWSQPPMPYVPDNVYNGWNEKSVYTSEQIAADDWLCTTNDPVADIHWWGSYIGWSESVPPEVPRPNGFHLAIWTDVAPNGSGYSHPGEVLWEYECRVYTWEFVGWDIDPRNPTAPPEACFKFSCDLPEGQWFIQGPGDNIYWVSIAAIYDSGLPTQYAWGWKTRPRDANLPAPDDGVRIFDPTAPISGSVWGSGEPIEYPAGTSRDLAFELTTKEAPKPDTFMFEFSLDIASDKELSDPQVDGDEAFDPGDVYWWRSAPVIPPGRDGFKDDLTIFGWDPSPNPPDGAIPPATRVPVPMLLPKPWPAVTYDPAYFDLDGHDQIDISLYEFELPYMPRELPKEQLPISQCIYPPQFLIISYDDDQAAGWKVGDVPVTVPSPAGIIYGSGVGGDELLSLVLGPAPIPPFPVLVPPSGIADEQSVHQSLAPNPGGDSQDDDVDSLDIVCSEGQCPIWYFTSDHEAPGMNPAGGPLDPGDIYQVTAAGPVLAIDAQANLGLPQGTDVDAFEFAWLSATTGGAPVLAVIFSVDEDDPLTPNVNESGGLNPNMIYYSLLAGWNSVLMSQPCDDDVDAITIWTRELPDVQLPFMISAVSRRQHGANPAQTFDVSLPLSPPSAAGIECRKDAVNNGPIKVVVTFNEPVSGPVTVTNATLVLVTPVGNDLVIDLSGALNNSCVKLDLSGITDASGNPLTGDTDIHIRSVIGEVNKIAPVNTLDLSAVKAQLFQPVTAANFRCDVNADDKINTLDLTVVKSNLFSSATCP